MELRKWLEAIEQSDLISAADGASKVLRVCERHFLSQAIYTDRRNKQRLQFSAFPLFNLPRKDKDVDEETASATRDTTTTNSLSLCIVPGCPNSKEKQSGVGYFKVPAGYKRSKWLEAADRPDLMSTTGDASKTLLICERHFFSHMISMDRNNKKILQLSAAPILNLPRSSTYLKKSKERKDRETNYTNILNSPIISAPIQSTSGEQDGYQIIKTEKYLNIFDDLIDIEMTPIKAEDASLLSENIFADVASSTNLKPESIIYTEDNIKTEDTMSEEDRTILFNEIPIKEIKEETIKVEIGEPEGEDIDEYCTNMEDGDLNTTRGARMSTHTELDAYSGASRELKRREGLVHSDASGTTSPDVESDESETEARFGGGPSYKPPALSRVARLFLREEPLPTATAAAPPPPHPTQGQLPQHLFHFEWRPLTLPGAICHHSNTDKLNQTGIHRPELFDPVHQKSKSKMTPLTAFTAIWDMTFMEQIATWTNHRAQRVLSSRRVIPQKSRYNWFVPATAAELHVYFAIIMAMGMCPKKNQTEYFRKTISITNTPNFSKYMAESRHCILNRFIRFSDEGDNKMGMTKEESQNKTFEKLLNHLNEKFQSLFDVDRDLIIDQSLQGFPEYWPMCKRVKSNVDIESFEVCDAKTGYMYRCHVSIKHLGDDEVPDLDISTGTNAIVLKLLSGLKNRGHSVYMDSDICNPALVRVLKSQGFDCIGVLNRSREFVPREVAQLRPGDVARETLGWTSGDMDIVSWNEHGRLLSMISTYHGIKSSLSKHGAMKPLAFLDYTTCMQAMDRTDSKLADYPIERQQSHVYKKLFRRLLNISIHNAYVIYKKSTGNLRYHDFRHALIMEMLGTYYMPSGEKNKAGT